jgi:uncharacterized protein (TIGR03083 family)
MNTLTIDVSTIAPIGHDEAMTLQAAELARTGSALRCIADAEWNLPTDCPAWDVCAMYRHVLGACEAGASLRENVHQLRRAHADRRREGGPLEAALSRVQVTERAALDGPAILSRLTAVAPRTVRGRTRTPSLVRRHVHLKVDGPLEETWTLGYLIDVIYLRDLWMHRIDLHRAVARTPVLTAEHDGRIVADIVAEWARRHGRPFVLELGGPAGGCYGTDSRGASAPISMDAVEFCRTLAGRASGTGLLGTVVPF